MAEIIRPIARFQLEKGKPKVIRERNTDIYSIKLSFPKPDSRTVTYTLDSSYYDPVRINENPQSGFLEDITS